MNMSQARIIGLTASPEKLAAMVLALEIEIGEIKENVQRLREKETRITQAARLHRQRHYEKQNYHCNCEVCAALEEGGKDEPDNEAGR